MSDHSVSNPSRILRVGFAALILAAVFSWGGRTLDSFAGFGFTMASLACGAVGVGLVIAEAMEYLSNPERRRPYAPDRRQVGVPDPADSVGRCGICHQRRIQRPGLVVCPTCDRHLTA